ncbi:hypothetical protein [Bilophila wadsworthia]|uniref:hypothetical protein n=1 Tax=Bilophila wadsworthia TaxID=35833 RepID=UPI002431E580|nr:hypothetical protein [Bilophila wadsworthia]
MDLQMVGEDRVALMGNGWMLEGNGGGLLAVLSRLNWISGAKQGDCLCKKRFYQKQFLLLLTSRMICSKIRKQE